MPRKNLVQCKTKQKEVQRKNLLRCKMSSTLYKALIFPLCNYTEMQGVDALQTYHPNYHNLLVCSVTFFDCHVAQLQLKLLNDADHFEFTMMHNCKEIKFNNIQYDIDQLVLIYLEILHKWGYPYVGQILSRCSLKLEVSPSIANPYNYILFNLILRPNPALIDFDYHHHGADSKSDLKIYSTLRGLYVRNTACKKDLNSCISFALNKYAHGSLHRRNCRVKPCGECLARFCKRYVCDDVANFIGRFVKWHSQ